ncbi:MAG TPA: ABC transporter ATP-binding protein [Gammaproteobacteria bacterium]|nr:ABC transporter ATP-binding protein [Gammaproteobacteria bacterium]
MEDQVLTLDNMTKKFGAFTAVNEVSFAVRRGEFLTLLGASGSGKTTILRMLAGFEHPTVGALMMNGRDISSVPPYRRRVNTVFQNYALFPHMTVSENVQYGLRFDKVTRAERRERARSMLARVGLEGKKDQFPSSLSGGQQQRVALARALIKQPEVLLLDEPLSALDAKLRKQLQLELKRVQRETGVTFVYVTHDQEEALVMSDRIAVLDSGQLMQIDTPQQVFERPGSLFVAEFLGISNKLRGLVEKRGQSTFVRLGHACAVRLGESWGTDLEPGERVWLGCRAEQLRVALSDSEQDNSVGASVKELIYLGTQTRLVLATADGVDLQVQLNSEDVPDGISMVESTELRVVIPEGAVHVFKDGADPTAMRRVAH